MTEKQAAAYSGAATTPRSASVETRDESLDVLPAAVRTALLEAVKVRKRVRSQYAAVAMRDGMTVLLRGASAQQVTLAADLMADAVARPAQVVPLSGLVHKYIGETEKNLDRIFLRAAEQSVVLLFDEADALFGKTTGVVAASSEVRASHDRYANQEVSYLMQRMAAYPGIVGVAVRDSSSLPDALVRRFDVVVSVRP